jgi:hypothetical protein
MVVVALVVTHGVGGPHDFSVMLCNTGESVTEEAGNLEILVAQLGARVIISAASSTSNLFPRRVRQARRPSCLCGPTVRRLGSARWLGSRRQRLAARQFSPDRGVHLRDEGVEPSW